MVVSHCRNLVLHQLKGVNDICKDETEISCELTEVSQKGVEERKRGVEMVLQIHLLKL